MQKVGRAVFLGVALLGAAVIGRASGASDAISIYVGGQLVGKGFVVGDQTYVPLRLIGQAMGADVEYDGANRRIEITRWGQPKQPVHPGYALDQTQGAWREVENSHEYVRFRDAAVTGDQFQAEIEIKPGLLVQTDKPVRVEFLVTLYGTDGQIVERGNQSVYNVSYDGGTYLIEGPSVLGGSSVSSCSIKYISAWMPRK
jgi:copper amine oxidase-like protein